MPRLSAWLPPDPRCGARPCCRYNRKARLAQKAGGFGHGFRRRLWRAWLLITHFWAVVALAFVGLNFYGLWRLLAAVGRWIWAAGGGPGPSWASDAPPADAPPPPAETREQEQARLERHYREAMARGGLQWTRGPARRRHVTRSSSSPAPGAGNRPTAGEHAGPARHRPRAKRGQAGYHDDGSRGARRSRDSTGEQRVGAERERKRRCRCQLRSAPGYPAFGVRSYQRCGGRAVTRGVTVRRRLGDAARADSPNLRRHGALASRSRSQGRAAEELEAVGELPLYRKVSHVTATCLAAVFAPDRVLE